MFKLIRLESSETLAIGLGNLITLAVVSARPETLDTKQLPVGVAQSHPNELAGGQGLCMTLCG